MNPDYSVTSYITTKELLATFCRFEIISVSTYIRAKRKAYERFCPF